MREKFFTLILSNSKIKVVYSKQVGKVWIMEEVWLDPSTEFVREMIVINLFFFLS